MGIYDRHYIRDEGMRGPGGNGGFLGAMRMWSANTWIIVLCVAVFAVDSFTPPQPVPGDIQPLVKNFDQYDIGALVPGDIFVTQAYAGRPLEGEQFLYAPVDLTRPVAKQNVFFMPLLSKYLHFSTYRGFFKVEFWRFIGFQFLHANIWHLLFNMMGLYFFGSLIEHKLGAKRYLAFYLLCGICGALMYTLLNLGGIVVSMFASEPVRIPGLLFNSPHTPLVGASAGVFGVLMAGAYVAPRAVVLLFFFIPMQLRTLAYALVVIALWTVIMGGQNAGGEAGHLGGAIAGFYFIRRQHHLHGFFDVLGWLDPTSHHYRGKKAAPRAAPSGRPRDSAEVDRILAKVHESGLQSLTERERQILKEASRE